MRSFLVVLLVFGLAFLGYEFLHRREGGGPEPTRAAERADGPRTLSEGRDAAPVEPVSGTIAELVDNPAPVVREEEERWMKALLQRDFSQLDPTGATRDTLPRGSPGRYAIEVALAQRSPGALDGLRDAACAVERAGAGATVPDLLAAGIQALSEAGHAPAAVAAMGGDNRFLAAQAGKAAGDALLARVGKLSATEQVGVLSQWLDALTRGPVIPWHAPHYSLLVASYSLLQDGLRGSLLAPGSAWKATLRPVKSGDNLDGIANDFEREHGLPMSAGLLRRLNNIADPRRMRAGITLRLPTERLRVVIEKGTYSMKVFLGDLLFRLYDVGLGEGGCTPELEFTVVEKEYKPAWTHPGTGELLPYGDPRNVLGDYYIKLEHPATTHIGIHGTADETSIGKNSSMGCIRMRAVDMAEVFDYLPRRVKVLVRP